MTAIWAEPCDIAVLGTSADRLAAQLAISLQAIEEAIRRGLLRFVAHRGVPCWCFGDSRNSSFRRIDGKTFRINGENVKAEAGTHGSPWHHLIGLQDIVENDRRHVLLVTEGSKDALAALHFADVEGFLPGVGIAVGLGSGLKVLDSDAEELRSRRVRIFGDADSAGNSATTRIAESLVGVAAEVQIFNLSGLNRDDGTPVKDLYDLTRIDYDQFEANRDLWSVTDLDSKGERVKTNPTRFCSSASPKIILSKHEFFLSPFSPPHVSRESHEFPVYPVSNSQELEKQLEELGVRNACTKCHTARARRWQLVRDLNAVEKRLARKLKPDELMRAFNKWYRFSLPYLDPRKTGDHYLAAFLAELEKVRVPTGEGEVLKKALERVLTLSVFELPILPGVVDAPENWRRLAALHRELARQSVNGTYFLSCRDAAKAHPRLNKDSANTINRALDRLGVIKLLRVGNARPGGNASEFRYLRSSKSEVLKPLPSATLSR